MNAPRSVREALLAQALGDVDQLLNRVQQLQRDFGHAQGSMTSSATALDEAGDRYRMTVAAFTDQARLELTEHLHRASAAVVSKTIDEQRAALQEAARIAFRSEAADKATVLCEALSRATRDLRRSNSHRWLEHATTALLASMLTLGLVLYFVR